MDLLLILISIPIMYFSIKGVIRGYNDQGSFRKQQLYSADVLGAISGIGLFIVGILKLFGLDIQ